MQIIIIRSMPDEWQQEFELNHAKTSDQSIRSVIAYFESQQSFKDRNKHLPKNSFQTITQNRLRIAEGNLVVHQENERVRRQLYNDNLLQVVVEERVLLSMQPVVHGIFRRLFVFKLYKPVVCTMIT